jgi:hypothetical protein
MIGVVPRVVASRYLRMRTQLVHISPPNRLVCQEQKDEVVAARVQCS